MTCPPLLRSRRPKAGGRLTPGAAFWRDRGAAELAASRRAGANDGIVSVAGIVIGVAGATTSRGPIFTAGLAGLVAGAVSMALGEYVSVSSQRDRADRLVRSQGPFRGHRPYRSRPSCCLRPPLRVPVTFAADLVALALTGALSARLGGSNVRRAVLRVVVGGALGLAFTYGVGHLFGTALG
jgi:vacuolar iron transporter family protein